MYKCKECNHVFEKLGNCPSCESKNIKELTNELYKYELIPEDIYNYELNKVTEILNQRQRIKVILALIFILSLAVLAFVANNPLLLKIDVLLLIASIFGLAYYTTKDNILIRNQEVLRKIKDEGVYVKKIPYKVYNYGNRRKNSYYTIKFEINKGKKLTERVDERVFTVNGPEGELNLFIDPTIDYCYVMNA